MSKTILTTTWLINNGFIQTGEYEFKRENHFVLFTATGCRLILNSCQQISFNGYVEDFNIAYETLICQK